MLERIYPSDTGPIHVQIEVTWRCNWRCVHCYQDVHDKRGPSTEQLLEVLRQLADSGTLHIIITGGEPLMRRDLVDVLQAARALDMGITLYTNGHLINDKMSATLASLIAAAELSILSGNPEIHDKLAGVRGAGDRAWHAATSLQDKGVAVTVKTPLMRPAVGTFEVLARRCASAGITWHPDADITGTYGGEAYPVQYGLTKEELDDFYQDFPSFNPASGYTTDPGMSDGICLAGRRYCFIDADGNVFPCLNFKTPSDLLSRSGNASPVQMGNVFEESFSDIWNSPVAREIRSRNGHDFRRCGDCAGKCSPCMAKNFEATGDLFDMGGSCSARAVASLRAPVMLGVPTMRTLA